MKKSKPKEEDHDLSISHTDKKFVENLTKDFIDGGRWEKVGTIEKIKTKYNQNLKRK
jgi:hypothetical protein